MANPRDMREQLSKEARVPLDVGYRNVESQRDGSGTFEAQRYQSLPPDCYRCPIPGIRYDGPAPVSTDVGQGDDWSWICVGDEGGTGRKDFWRQTIHRL